MALGFAHDILPLFRHGDIVCMSGHGVALNNFGFMSDITGDADYLDHANARHVYARLSGTEKPQMPPDPGGHWEKAKLDTFSQWMTDGFLP